MEERRIQEYKENGFTIIPEFLSQEEVNELKMATTHLISKYCADTPISIFKNYKDKPIADEYFCTSGDKIRGFYEDKAMDETGNIIVPKEEALNKIAHALHKFDPVFHRITFSKKVQDVLQKFNPMKRPIINQSMVIFKHPLVGGVVIPHQDSTFLYTDPVENTLIGFWIALDEASLENGCLKFVPGSHKEGKVYERYVRNPDKNSTSLFMTRGEKIPTVPTEKLVPAPCKPGDLVLINGLVIHQSEPNTSTQRRMAYTFHIHEGTAKWSEENWLQPTTENTFVPLEVESMG